MTLLIKELDPHFVAKLVSLAMDVDPRSAAYRDIVDIATEACMGVRDTYANRLAIAGVVCARFEVQF